MTTLMTTTKMEMTTTTTSSGTARPREIVEIWTAEIIISNGHRIRLDGDDSLYMRRKDWPRVVESGRERPRPMNDIN